MERWNSNEANPGKA